MASIKPCPFCGSFDTKIVQFGNQHDHTTAVQCTSCKALGPEPKQQGNTEISEAIKLWNDRIE